MRLSLRSGIATTHASKAEPTTRKSPALSSPILATGSDGAAIEDEMCSASNRRFYRSLRAHDLARL